MSAVAHRPSVQRLETIFLPLTEKGLLPREALAAALVQALADGTDPAAFLIDRHQLPKAAVGEALGSFYRCPFLDLDPRTPIPPGLMAGMSLQYLRVNLWLPLRLDGNTLHFAVDDPHANGKLQDIQQLYPSLELRPAVALRRDILAVIDAMRKADVARRASQTIDSLLGRGTEKPSAPPAADPEEAPAEDEPNETDGVVVRLVNTIIAEACAAGASDIHLEPYRQKDMIVRFRVDGECRIHEKVPASFRRAVVARIKIMAGLDIAERRRPQDGKILMRVQEREIELRVATIPTVAENEDVVMRVLASGAPVPINRLGLSPRNYAGLSKALDAPHGLVLCVGPTGSGKTTTLHSALGYLNGPDVKIWTAEDPVEITQYGLRQVQVQPKIGITFAAVLRSFLRADPDVIMVGEMRDQETAEIAVQAALTGHLVLSTLHTNSAAETVTRLLELGLDPYNCADALEAVLAQRLVRRLCAACRWAYHPTRDEFEELADAYGREIFGELGVSYGPDTRIYRKGGCAACGQTGYLGRVGLHELLTLDEELRVFIRRSAPAAELARAAAAKGMRTLLQDGVAKCFGGLTDLSQVRAASK